MVRRILESTLLVVCLSASTHAFATKEMDEKLAAVQKDAKYTAALDAMKSTCGCSPKVSIDAKSYAKSADMNRVPYALESAGTAAKSYCSADKYKKAFCAKVKDIHVSYAKDVPAATLTGGTLSLSSNNLGYSGDKGISKLFDSLAD